MDEKDVSDDYESSDDDDDDLVDWDEPVVGAKTRSTITTQQSHLNQQKNSDKITKYQSADKLFNKVAGKINIDAYEVPGGNVLKSVSGGR